MATPSVRALCVCALGLLLITAGCMQNEPETAAPAPGTPDLPEPGSHISNETLVAFVESAVAYAHANGKEKALAEFSNPNGSFVQGELYIYAYDFNNVALAHPVNPEKIGVSRMDELDAFGNPYTRQFIDAAKNGSGFVRFYYINPAHNRTVESKLGYVMKPRSHRQLDRVHDGIRREHGVHGLLHRHDGADDIRTARPDLLRLHRLHGERDGDADGDRRRHRA